MTQRRDIHGARSKNQNTDRGRDRSKEGKVSLKSKMKRCTGGRSAKSERKRIPDSWSSKEERSILMTFIAPTHFLKDLFVRDQRFV